MPKLPAEEARKVEENESTGFDALPEGPYVATLVEVDGSKSGPAGPYWSWKFEVAEPEEHEGRFLWVNTSLADNARWKMNEVFTAFGVPADTDTDELITNVVTLIVSQRVIDRGARKGQIGNNVDSVLPYGGGDVPGEGEVW